MAQIREIVRALAGNFHAVAARRAGRFGELGIVFIEVDVSPRGDALAAGRELHDFAGVGIDALPIEAHLIAHIHLADRNVSALYHRCVVFLLQLEPDGVLAGVGEVGQFGGVFAVLGGSVGHGNVLGGDIELDRVRFAVIDAIVATGTMADPQRLDLHGRGFHDGRIRPLQLVPDGIAACVGECGRGFGERAVLRGGVAHRDVVRGDVQRNRVRLAVVVAAVALHAVYDRPHVGQNGKLMVEPCEAVGSLAVHVHAVFARKGGGAGKCIAVFVVIGERPRYVVDAVSDIEFGCEGYGRAAQYACRKSGHIRMADIMSLNRHGGRAYHSLVARPFEPEPDRVFA